MSQAGQAGIGSSGSGGITSISGDSGGTATGPAVFIGSSNSGIMFDIQGNAIVPNFDFLEFNSSSASTGYVSIAGTGKIFSVFGVNNLFAGTSSGNNTLTASACVGIGAGSLQSVTSGTSNTGCGSNTLPLITTGVGNTAIGLNAGSSYTSSESSNILIGPSVSGTAGESGVIRIGRTGAGGQNQCFVSGINGVSTANAVPVTIDSSSGQLGVGTAGQTQSSAISQGSAVSLTTATPTNVTSISLTAGTWSVSVLGLFGGSPTVTGAQQLSISTTSATHGTLGNNSSQSPWATSNFAVSNVPVTIPSYTLTVAVTTTVFMVASGVFGAGTMNAYGRITAVKLT